MYITYVLHYTYRKFNEIRSSNEDMTLIIIIVNITIMMMTIQMDMDYVTEDVFDDIWYLLNC